MQYNIPTNLEDCKVVGHAYDFKIFDNKETGRTSLYIWAMSKTATRYLLRQENCPVYCYVILPKKIGERKVSWNPASSMDVYEHLRRVLKEDAPVNYRFKSKKELYNFQNGRTISTMKLYFNSIKAMDHCYNLLRKPANVRYYGSLQLEMVEKNISIIRKILTLRDCKYAQWFEITGKELPLEHEDRISVGGENGRIKEVLIDWTNLSPIPQNLTSNWVSPIKILSFDIETYSTNHKKMPNELCIDHPAYMLQGVSQIQGMRHTRKRYAILIGDCNPIKVGTNEQVTYQGKEFTLDPDVRIYRVNSEPELVQTFADIVMESDPDVIIGYNIFSYDYKYIDTRLGMFYMTEWPQMGRISGVNPVMNKREWSSSAYGTVTICNLEMDGRINIDLLPIVKRDYKLDKYTLDFVCKNFLKRGKHDVKASQMFKIYEFMSEAKKIKTSMEKYLRDNELPDLSTYKVEDLKETATISYNGEILTPYQVNNIWNVALDQMTKVVKYGVEDAELVIDLFEKLNIWIGLVELSSIVGVSITDIFTRGQQVRCHSQIYDLGSKLEYLIVKRDSIKRCFNGAFVGDPTPGLYNNIICLDFASLYPNIIIAYNMCYTTFVTDDTVPDSMCNVIEFDQEEDESGKREKGDDLADLYTVDDADEDDSDKKESKKVTKHYRFRFVKKEILEGLVPRLVDNLVNERNIVKGQIKTTKKLLDRVEELLIELKRCETKEIQFSDVLLNTCDLEFKKHETELMNVGEDIINNYLVTIRLVIYNLNVQLIILDKRQNALKVSANSIFGFLGAQNKGMLPFIEVAMCVTAMGRILIGQVNDYAKTKYGAEIIYNDTDSSMIDMHITDSKTCNYWGYRLAEEISGKPESKDKHGNIVPAVPGLFPPPLRMEFEKAMRLLCFKKKKYAALLIDGKGEFIRDPDTGDLNIMKKGIVPARRDNFLYLRDNYVKLLTNILLMNDMHSSFSLIIDCVHGLLSGSVKVRGNMTIIKSLGAEYKNDNFCMKLFATELARVGKPPNPGERLEYVIVKTEDEIERGEKPLLGYKMRDIDMWEDSYRYYNKKWGDENKQKASDDTIASLPESLAKILNVVVEKNEKPIYSKEDIDYLYYLEHSLMNPIDQLFNVGYKKQLDNYASIGYTPVNSRRQFCSIQTPIKMVVKMIVDLNKGNVRDEEILNIIRNLKNWLREIEETEIRSEETNAKPALKIKVVKEPQPKLKLKILRATS